MDPAGIHPAGGGDDADGDCGDEGGRETSAGSINALCINNGVLVLRDP